MSMQSMPLVTVLLPLYNESLVFARESIDSMLNQTYPNLELILLLDNPRNEELKCLINNYAIRDKRVKIHLNVENLGLPTTLNVGIDMSAGEYIARMDGDDISLPNRLEKQLEFLLEHPNIDMLGSDAYIINEDGQRIGEYHKLRTDFSQKQMLRKATVNLIHPTWFGKSTLFRQCKYRNFMHCEDFDFMARAYALGANFYNLQEKLLSYRVQQNSCSISRKYAYEQYMNTLRVRKQLNDFLKRKMQSYPGLPQLTFDLADKQRYQSTIPLLNQLRESFFQREIWTSLKLSMKIVQIDSRPITSRIRVLLLSRFLFLLEGLKLKTE